MAPSKFQIYVDQSMRKPSSASVVQPQPQQPVENIIPSVPPEQNQDQPLRYKPEVLPPTSRFYFNERKIYPVSGGEYSFEELNFFHWQRHQRQLAEKKRVEDIREENEELRLRIETLSQQLSQLVSAQNQMPRQRENENQNPPSPPASNRLSVVPQSLQPAQGGLEYTDLPQYEATNEAPSSVIYYWRDTLGPDVSRTTFAHDKFTLPIDQSQFIRENVPTSTPTSKRPAEKRNNFDNRRMSRPSMGGSPTLKLSPITETSRECNSKSSSSSSAMTATPSTTKKVQPLALEPLILDEPERPLDPNDPTTYRRLLTRLSEPFVNCFRLNRCLPKIRQGACFQAGSDEYLVDKELSREAKMFTAQLLTEDSNDTTDYPIKTICFRLDQPANEWLCYVCNELHRRLVKQKAKPDIELSVMIANPAVFYNDGSILIDEEFRFVTLENYFEACSRSNKPFPKSVAAYITLELIQLVRRMHSCDIVHMNISPKNVLIICCPTREDITNVCERTSIVKLIGFDRAMDMRLLPPDYKFDTKLDDFMTCEMVDSRPWSYEIDWYGVLNCIHQMFFLEEMSAQKDKGRWGIDKQFKGLPTNVWGSMFDELLNMVELTTTNSLIDEVTETLNTWVKANLSFVLKEADSLDRILTESTKNTEVLSK